MIMESNPDSALSIMLGINTATLRSSRRMHMEYIMLLANAQNRSDNPMMSLEELLPAMKYFVKKVPVTREPCVFILLEESVCSTTIVQWQWNISKGFCF